MYTHDALIVKRRRAFFLSFLFCTRVCRRDLLFSRDRQVLFAHASGAYDKLERVRKSEERAVVRSRPPAMNLLLCYYCFGRAAHARCLSHSAYPAPLRHDGRVNKPLTYEPRQIDNTPRHATSPFFFSLSPIYLPTFLFFYRPIHRKNEHISRRFKFQLLPFVFTSREMPRNIFEARIVYL